MCLLHVLCQADGETLGCSCVCTCMNMQGSAPDSLYTGVWKTAPSPEGKGRSRVWPDSASRIRRETRFRMWRHRIPRFRADSAQQPHRWAGSGRNLEARRRHIQKRRLCRFSSKPERSEAKSDQIRAPPHQLRTSRPFPRPPRRRREQFQSSRTLARLASRKVNPRKLRSSLKVARKFPQVADDLVREPRFGPNSANVGRFGLNGCALGQMPKNGPDRFKKSPQTVKQ